MAFNSKLIPEKIKEKIFHDIGNMIETNINGCDLNFFSHGGESVKPTAIESLRALHAFLNNDNKHMKNLKKTVNSGGGARDMEAKSTFGVYEEFSNSLHVVLKAINSMTDSIENDKSGKATDILAIIEGKRGILVNMFRKLIVVVTDEENKDNRDKKLSSEDVRFTQEFSFRKFRVERCEQAMVKALKEIDGTPNNVAERSIKIVDHALSMILSETAYMFKLDSK